LRLLRYWRCGLSYPGPRATSLAGGGFEVADYVVD
jgi:hypothetical protein